MAQSSFKNVKISGCSVVLGENKVHFNDNPFYYNDNPAMQKRLKQTMGFGWRYKANPTTTASDLCLKAAQNLMQKMKFSSGDFDAIISVTQTPDYHMPGNAHVIHKNLACPKTTLALDVGLGCSGFVYGLWLAYMMVENGLKRILLVAGDTFSKMVHPLDKAAAPIFGDAGSATIIERTDYSSESFFILKSNGLKLEALYQPAGAFRIPSTDETSKEKKDSGGNIRTDENIYMNGLEIMNFTLEEQVPTIDELLQFCKKNKDEIDYFVFHQANKYIVESLAKSAKVDLKKVPIIFSEYGNQTSASIPGAICAALIDKLSPAKYIVLHGFGIGLSWGACQLIIDNPIIIQPEIYTADNI